MTTFLVYLSTWMLGMVFLLGGIFWLFSPNVDRILIEGDPKRIAVVVALNTAALAYGILLVGLPVIL